MATGRGDDPPLPPSNDIDPPIGFPEPEVKLNSPPLSVVLEGLSTVLSRGLLLLFVVEGVAVICTVC